MGQKTTENEITTPSYLKISKILVWLMYFWVMIGVVSLALRVFLLAFSANMEAGFSNFVLTVSNDYMQPFRGIFTGRELGETGYLDVSALFAIIVYLFVAWAFKALIEYIELKIAQNLDQQQDAALNRVPEKTTNRNVKTATRR